MRIVSLKDPHIDIEAALDRILPQVTKPARYIGGEPNSARKPLEDINVSFALAFPDVYEIGMSNLGLRILYHILNNDHRVSAERVFAPAKDMEALMREHGIPLFALESRRPLACFDFIGFSLAYELSFTAVINMLDLAGIPIFSKDRTDSDPIIVAGGHCTSNPEPMSPYIDVFAFGDGEDVVVDLVKAYREAEYDRSTALKLIADIPGIYVPGIHGTETGIKNIQARAVASLEDAPYPDSLMIPHTEAVHDRVVLEIMRGCTRGCRFCQAGMLTRPVRERSVELLCNQAEQLLRGTGYDEIALSSLSSADHSRINELVAGLINRYEEERVGISLPSLRADAGCVKLAAEIQRVRKSGLTFAPEAGTQRLRDVINKNVTEDDLLNAVAAAVSSGWKRLKLYFMIGLPTETDDDIAGIADLVRSVLSTSRNLGVKLALNITISPFVPKPHTPFQWNAMVDTDELQRRITLLRSLLKIKGVQLSWHEPGSSRIEAALARGDARVGSALYEAWKLGANLGQERFDYDLWENAFNAAGLNISDYANREYAIDEVLPWDFVFTGVSKAYLASENRKAIQEITTDDCRNGCTGCGVKAALDLDSCPPKPVTGKLAEVKHIETSDTPEVLALFRFSKTGRAKWLGHLDLVRIFERAVRTSGIDVVYSEGFNPRPRIALLSALPLGATADADVLTIRLHPGSDVTRLLTGLNSRLPEGLKVYDLTFIRGTVRPPAINAGEFIIGVSIPEGYNRDDVHKAIESVMAQDIITVDRGKDGHVKPVNLREGIISLELNEAAYNGCCELKAVVSHGDFTVRPSEIVELVGRSIPGLQLMSIRRSRLILRCANGSANCDVK